MPTASELWGERWHCFRMRYPTFDELPYFTRPDLTPYLLHLTKNSKDDDYSAFDNLRSILRTGRINASDPKEAFIRGPNGATCLMDVPFASLKYVLTPRDTDPDHPRYEPLGVIITKPKAYEKGCRPVLHLSKAEAKALGIPRDELWRVVTHEPKGEGWVSWIHEREWRCKGNLRLPRRIHAAIVRDTREARVLRKEIAADPKGFKCKPSSIMVASVICQGLLK